MKNAVHMHKRAAQRFEAGCNFPANKKTTKRRCVGCREMKEKSALIRVARTAGPKGGFFVDLTSKADGRGAYVCRSTACLAKAKKQKGLERSFKNSELSGIYAQLMQEVER